MRNRWVKTNWLVKKIFNRYTWNIPNRENTVYLTFDDGPTPEITPWVLGQLKKYDARATFFCVGNHLAGNRELLAQMTADGHTIGNHTFNHRNGWNTDNKTYLEDIANCQKALADIAHSDALLFRPPYGKIKPSQSWILRKKGYQIIMWDVLSRDFDAGISAEKCLQNVCIHLQPGSIVVFHDSRKAWANLEYVLPKALEFIKEKGWVCKAVA